jgi:CelD/BcsL family acetyltransferase involved in cellulose biosynthesis
MRVEIIRDEESLAALAEDWWMLWRRAAATPFISPAWLLPWWRAFRPGSLLSVALRDDDARLVALAPFYVEDGAHGRRLLPVGIALSDYLDVLIDPAYTGGRAALARAFDAEPGWDSWSLEELPPGAAALAIHGSAHWRESLERQSACPVLHLPPSRERLSESVPAVRLRKLRTARNRAKRRGGYVIERIGETDAPRFLQALYRLHGARWASQGEPGVLQDERLHRFHSQAAAALLAAGLARLFLISLDGRAVGAYYGLCDGRRAFGYLTGFDPAYAFESPGAVIVGHAIESAVAEGCETFHFLRGRESYKYGWGAADAWSVRRVFVRVPAPSRNGSAAIPRSGSAYA